jgi:ABC-type lipoprotein release transport system permease subunit
VGRVLRRQWALLECGLASLLRRPGKALVLWGVLTLIVFLLASLALLAASVRGMTAGALEGAPDLIVRREVAGRQDLVPVDWLRAVRGVPGVQEARGRLWGYYYDAALGANYTVLVPARGAPAPQDAVVGAGIARSREVSAADILSLRSYRGEDLLLSVSGLLPAASELFTSDLVLVSEEDFRRLYGMPADAVNDLAVRLAPAADPEAARAAIAAALPGAGFTTRGEMRAVAAAFLDWRSGLTAILVLAMALALGILGGDKLSALSADEQQEMGILRALGWSTWEVLTAKLWESLAVSIVALLAGMLAAYAHIFLWEAALFTPVLRGWAVLFPLLRLVPDVDLGAVGLIAAGAILVPAAGSLLACYRPAAGDPEAALRE